MRRSITFIVSLLAILTVLLSACTPAATSTAAPHPGAAQQATNTSAPEATNSPYGYRHHCC